MMGVWLMSDKRFGEFETMFEQMKAKRAEAEADERARSVGGVPWHEAPAPPRFQRCYSHTSGYVGLFDLVQRCSCGAIRNPGISKHWMEKNSRRKSDREELRRKWRGQA